MLLPAKNRFRITVFQCYRVSRFQGFRVSELRGFSILNLVEMQICNVTGVAIIVINPEGKIVYEQQVPEIGEEPDYAKAMDAIK